MLTLPGVEFARYWQYLGKEKYARLISLVRPLSTSIVDQGGIPMPNPMGVPRPWTRPGGEKSDDIN